MMHFYGFAIIFVVFRISSAFVYLTNPSVHSVLRDGGTFSLRQQRYLSQEDGGFIGLTEDGDFALFGINAEDPALITDDEEKGPIFSSAMSKFGLDNNLSALLAGNAMEERRVDSLAPIDKNLRMADKGVAGPREPTQVVKYDDKNVHVDPEEQSWLEAWLLEMIPTLKPNDVGRYARKLVLIGFDPECITRSEITLDDLSFMKTLHRRFLFKKISDMN